jgi:hypothetical protein
MSLTDIFFHRAWDCRLLHGSLPPSPPSLWAVHVFVWGLPSLLSVSTSPFCCSGFGLCMSPLGDCRLCSVRPRIHFVALDLGCACLRLGTAASALCVHVSTLLLWVWVVHVSAWRLPPPLPYLRPWAVHVSAWGLPPLLSVSTSPLCCSGFGLCVSPLGDCRLLCLISVRGLCMSPLGDCRLCSLRPRIRFVALGLGCACLRLETAASSASSLSVGCACLCLELS